MILGDRLPYQPKFIIQGEKGAMKANTTKKTAAGFFKKAAEKFASYACGSASILGLRQPKEPENLKFILKK